MAEQTLQRKRKASFVGTEEWRRRDVDITEVGDTLMVKDKPTGMSIRSLMLSQEELLTALAHRVRQLS